MVQLSLGAVTISGVIDADSKFLLHLMPDLDGTPREPTQTLLKEVLSMMEKKWKEGMDMPCQRNQRLVHRIFLKHYEVD